jgi:hypothetical protein
MQTMADERRGVRSTHREAQSSAGHRDNRVAHAA